MRFRMTQHPVGQGGLFSGNLLGERTTFNWVYDCGSNQQTELTNAICLLPNDPIDMLFLSHFDSDHVNGIDQLVTQHHVNEVVLPYFDKITAIWMIAKDAALGQLNGNFVNAVSDLAGWFGDRGLETITFVRGDYDGGSDGAFLPEPTGGSGETGELKVKWTVKPEDLPHAVDSEDSRSYKHKTLSRSIDPNATASLHLGTKTLNWVFIPHAFSPPKRLMLAFEAALKIEFGDSCSKDEVLNSARNHTGRQKLKKCYDALWINHNLVSMSLYCGPANSLPTADTFVNDYDYYHDIYGCPAGWLLTGDSQLKTIRRQKALIQKMKKVSGNVGIFMAPHHGAESYFSANILGEFPNLGVGYVAAGTNSYGHPHNAVKQAFSHFYLGLRQVSEDTNSILNITGNLKP